MDTPKLQWSAAEVSGGVLKVPIDGECPKGWKGVFERTVVLLGRGQWDEVKLLKGGTVRVKGVREGSEDALRHFLEGVVQEANATTAPDDEDTDGHDDDSSDEGTDGDDSGGDAALTERFREFGESTAEQPADSA